MFSSCAVADWTAVAGGNNIFSVYADKDSIRRHGANASMSGMYEFRKRDYTPEGKGLFSTVVLREYDCEQRQLRLLSSIDFSGHMGAGSVVDSSRRAGRWESIVPGGVDEAYWKIACGRK